MTFDEWWETNVTIRLFATEASKDMCHMAWMAGRHEGVCSRNKILAKVDNHDPNGTKQIEKRHFEKTTQEY